MVKYGTVDKNPGCLGLNKAKAIKKNKDGTYKLTLSVCGVANRSGHLVPPIKQELIDVYNRRPIEQRIVLFRSSGMDSLRGDVVSTLMRQAMADVCGVLHNVQAVKEGYKQVIVGDFQPIGPKSHIFKALIEDEDNTLMFGHRFTTEATQAGNGNYIPSKAVATNIVGFDVIGNVL